VVSSTLYALRVHPIARELLGEDISFKSKMPWIQGTMNQLRGDIDITYGVKGTKGEGVMHFRSVRRERMGLVSFFPQLPCPICSGEVLVVAVAEPSERMEG